MSILVVSQKLLTNLLSYTTISDLAGHGYLAENAAVLL